MDYEEMVKLLTDGGLTRDQAEKFIEAERAMYADRPTAFSATVSAWREIADACRAVDAPKLAGRFMQAGVSLHAAREMLMQRVTVKGARPLTMTAAAEDAVGIALLSLAHNRGRIAA